MSVNTPTEDTLLPVEWRYLIVTWVPYYVDADGSIWMQPLWHRDFLEHLRYLRRVTLGAPRLPKGSQADLVKLEIPPGVEVSFIHVPQGRSLLQALLLLPATTAALWRAVGKADLVHSGIAGWPYPLGWIANALALLRRRKLIIMVESAPWRVKGTPEETWRYRARGALTEALGRWFVNHAHLSVFTQQSYLDTLRTSARGRGVVTPSSWVQGDEIISRDLAARSWQAKAATAPADVKLLFAGRLTYEKGVDVLLEAARLLEARGVALQIDIIGEGPLREDCLAAARSLRTVRMSVLDPVPYGAPFFELVRRYHVVVVPTVNDVQTRVLFDAYAQAVPVLATDTVGMRPYIAEGETGWLVPCKDAAALASVMTQAASDPANLERMGRNARDHVSRFTHGEMHRARWRVLLECFGAAPSPASSRVPTPAT